MPKLFTLLFCTIASFCLAPRIAFSQVDTAQMPPVPQQPVQVNAGFDVIIKLNGEIVHGLVKEVGPYYILYKRTDIPDGPVYSIPRNEVYAISYRNQVKDYLQPVDGRAPVGVPGVHAPGGYPGGGLPNRRLYGPMFSNGTAHLGIGFIRGFSKVKNVNTYSTTSSSPVILFAYDAAMRSGVRVGAQMGFGGRKFSKQEFSSYDSTLNNISLKENVFALYVYGRYTLANTTSKFQPYIMLGLGITSSNVKSENTISFTNDNSQEILVKSGARAAGLGILARVGTQYIINNQLSAFIDAGAGLSVLSLGVSFNMQ